MGNRTRFVARPMAVLAALALLASTALAGEPGVKDDAGMFSGSAVQQATADLQKLKQQYNHTVNVETYASTPPELAGKVDGNDASKEAAYRTFTEGRAASIGTDVYVFITKSPGHVQVTARKDLARSGLTPQGRDRMRAELVNAFKQRDFDGGLTNMTRSLAATYAGTPNQPAANAPQQSTPTQTRSAPPPANPWPGSSNTPTESHKSGGLLGGIGCFGIVIIVVILFVVIRLIGRLFGNRNRNNYPPQGGNYGPGQQGPPPGGYGANYGGGYPPNQGGGGFGRGVGGGILGGLLGSWIGGNVFGGQSHHDSSSSSGGGGVFGGGSNDSGNTGGADTSGFGSSGGDFGSGGSSSGFDSGGGGSDFSSSGGDFGGGDSGGGGGDSGGGGGDF